jgi:hypothetical protein
MTATSPAAGLGGSAERWGALWGARPAEWALSEDQQTPTYEEPLHRVELRPGQLGRSRTRSSRASRRIGRRAAATGSRTSTAT